MSFDPRGFGFSTAVRCFPSVAAENNFLASLPPFPVGARQDAAWERTWARFDALCAQRNGRLLDHVTSADTARDMNLLRQAVGAATLNYLGVSDGSVLGAIYANLFPATTGHMVFDGSVDPVALTSGGALPASLREGQDLAAAAELRSYLDLCGQAPVSACAFSAGTPAATEAKFAALEKILLRQPVNVGTPPQTVSYAGLLVDIPLGDVDQWQGSAVLLQQLWVAATSPSGAVGQLRGLPARRPAQAPRRRRVRGRLHRGGADRTPWAAPTSRTRAASATTRPPPGWPRPARAGTGCSSPGRRSRARTGPPPGPGPVHRPVEPPHRQHHLGDEPHRRPAYHPPDAIAMTRELARARLLTIDGFGHTELANPSTCAVSYEVRYLTTGALPPAGTICQQDVTPFAAPAQ